MRREDEIFKKKSVEKDNVLRDWIYANISPILRKAELIHYTTDYTLAQLNMQQLWGSTLGIPLYSCAVCLL